MAWYEKASDDFNRADENPLAGNWATLAGTNGMQIVSGRCRLVTEAAENSSIYTATTFGNNQYSQAKRYTGAIYSYLRYHVRATSGGSTQNTYQYTVGGLDSYLYKIVANTYTEIGSNSSHSTITAGAVSRVECEGTTIRTFYEGIEKHSVTDSTFTSGYPGLGHYNLAGGGHDDWSAGDDVAPQVKFSPFPAGRMT